jgi:hypothetical protein
MILPARFLRRVVRVADRVSFLSLGLPVEVRASGFTGAWVVR